MKKGLIGSKYDKYNLQILSFKFPETSLRIDIFSSFFESLNKEKGSYMTSNDTSS